MTARIYCPAKTAMQSGRAGTRRWLLEYVPSAAKSVDSLTGWTGSSDMMADEIRLWFETRDAAVAYAERHGIRYSVIERRQRRIKPKSYADNFRWERPGS